MNLNITIEQLREAMQRKGYRFFERGDLNLNIIAVRSADTDSNAFNDLMLVAFKRGDKWQLKQYAMTTDPGIYYRENPMNVLGTAVLAPGQHNGAFCIGVRKGRYPALVQARPLPVYRDNNRDAQIDFTGELDAGWHSIQVHHAREGGTSQQVDKWSAGCQVLANFFDHNELMALCDEASEKWGPRFTYTLLDEGDLV